MATVFIPEQWRDLTGGSAEVHAEGLSLRQVIAALDTQFPGIGARVCDGDAIASGLAVSIDGAMTGRGLLGRLMPRVKSISCRQSAAVSRCYRDYRCRRHRQDARPLASFHPACVRWSMAGPDLRRDSRNDGRFHGSRQRAAKRFDQRRCHGGRAPCRAAAAHRIQTARQFWPRFEGRTESGPSTPRSGAVGAEARAP